MATGFRNVLACLLLLVGPMAWAQVDLDAFLKADRYGQIKLSPGGDYFAAEIPVEDRTVLAIIRRADKAFTAKVEGGKRSRIGDFWWASDTRVVVAMAERFGSMDQPFLTGELHAVDVDGRRGRMLIGHDGPRHGEGQQVGGVRRFGRAAAIGKDGLTPAKHARTQGLGSSGQAAGGPSMTRRRGCRSGCTEVVSGRRCRSGLIASLCPRRSD